jgi:geranylgeranyl diphosphate synthase type I
VEAIHASGVRRRTYSGATANGRLGILLDVGGDRDARTRADVRSRSLESVRERVDPVIARFLSDRRAELSGMEPRAAVLVDELLRLIAAGGKRIRPALCFWAYRAAGGADGPAIVNAAAALELLHTFALVHDDVMDRTDERRGVEATHVRFAKEAPPGVEPDGYGVSVAILVGDLAAVLAEQRLRTCGAQPRALELAMERFDRMRAEMAAGQLLDVAGAAADDAGRVAALKTSSYTAEGPILIGTALAEAPAAAEGPLRVYARLVGEAFQLRDDVLDGDAHARFAARADELASKAVAALDGAPLEDDGRSALGELASALRLSR